MNFKAKDLLDFQPTLFEEALKTTIEWYDKEFVSQYDYRHSISKGYSRIFPFMMSNFWGVIFDPPLGLPPI